MVTNTSFSPSFSLPKNAMYVNSSLVVRRQKIQLKLLSLFKGMSGHQSITTTKTPHYIYSYKIRVRVGEWDWGRVPSLKHLPLYPLVNLPEGNPMHSPLYLRLW